MMCNHLSMRFVRWRFKTLIEVRKRMSNYMSLFYENAFTYPYHNPRKIGAMLSYLDQDF